MRKGLVALLGLLLLAAPAIAQVEFTGNLFVVVSSEDGNPIVGASVKLTGTDYGSSGTTNDNGRQRFIRLYPGKYELEVSARGYNTQILTDVRIETLANAELQLKLVASTTEERVVVTALTPLINRRNAGTQTVIATEELEQIPTSRDPWAVLSTIPGVNTDRVNVGGNESGQQSVAVGKGDTGASSTWVMDGVEFTDNAAEGASASYLDFNSFNQIGFVSGGADVEQSTPGLRLNFVTKQGTNQHSGTARLLFADEDLQADIPVSDNPAWVVADGGAASFSGNGINEVFEKNFDIGGPILKDKLWYWGGFTQNDIDISVGGTPDRTKLRNLSLKVHGQAGQGKTSYRVWWTEGDKIKDGRGAGPTRPLPTTWDQEGPTPITSVALSQFFGSNLQLDFQWGKVDGGFQLVPKGGTDPGSQIILDEAGVWQNTFFQFVIDRPSTQYAIKGNWFATTGSWEHEVKFGFRYRDTERTTSSLYGGGDRVMGFVGALDNVGGVDPLQSSVGFYRDGLVKDETDHLNVWIGDTMLKGNWAISFGFNWATQSGKQLASTVGANPIIPMALPAAAYAGGDQDIEWSDIMPRVGATYTFGGDRRTLVKASVGQFVDTLSNADVGFSNPVALSALFYPWADTNDDRMVQAGEVDLMTLLGASNIDPANPSDLTFTNLNDPNVDAPVVTEFILGVEHEIARSFSIGANFTWREREDDLHRPLWDTTAATVGGDGNLTSGSIIPILSDSYDCTSTTSGTFADGSGSWDEPFCTLTAGATGSTTLARGTVLTNRSDLTTTFQGLELTATKRLSNRWMLRGFIAWNNWEQDFGGRAPTADGLGLNVGGMSSDRDDGAQFLSTGIDGDPTNLVGGKADDGGLVAVQSGGSGSKGDVWLGTSQWQFNVNGMYQLPKGWAVSANWQMREGYGIPLYDQVAVADPDGFTQQKQIQLGSNDDDRYDDINVFDLKIAKTFIFQGNSNVELALELFNLFDDDTILQYGRRADVDNQFFVVRETLSPQILRFGMTVNF